MDEPPDIRRASRHENITGFMRSVRLVTIRKLAVAGTELVGEQKWDAALENFEEAAALCLEIDEPLQRSNMLSMASLCLFALSRFKEAKESIVEAIELKKKAGEMEGAATDMLGLGEILIKKGDLEEAEGAFQESLSIFQSLKIGDGIDSANRGLDKVRKAISASGAR